MGEAFIGVDVGTGSARAGIFAADGRLLASAQRAIAIWREPGEIVEHSSRDIWGAVTRGGSRGGRAGRRRARAMSRASASTPPARSSSSTRRRLVAGRPERRSPIATPSSGWTIARSPRPMRSTRAATKSCATSAGRFRRKCSRRSCNWLARHAPETFARGRALFRPDRFSHLSRHRLAGAVGMHRYLQMDLPRARAALVARIFSTRRARRAGRRRIRPDRRRCRRARHGARARPDRGGGRGDGAEAWHSRRRRPDRRACGRARHDGRRARRGAGDPRRRLALILGTSSCCMAVSDEPRFIRGVWGPYYSALVSRPMADRGRAERVRRSDRPSHAHASGVRRLLAPRGREFRSDGARDRRARRRRIRRPR